MPEAPKASPPPAPPAGPVAPRRAPSARAVTFGSGAAALVAVGAWALRPRSPSPPADAAPAAASAPAPPDTSPRWAPPFAGALRADGSVFVAGRRRGAGGLLLGSFDFEGKARAPLELPLDAAGRPAEVETFAAPSGVVVSIGSEGGQRQWLRAPSPEALLGPAWEPTEPSACATGREVALLARAEAGFQPRLAPLGGGASVDAGAPLAGTAASLLCGATRAYVVVDRDREHVARSLGVGLPLDVALSGEREQGDVEQSFHAYAAGDDLLAVRFGAKRGVHFRAWDGTAPEAGPWVRADVALADDASLELALATGDAVALVTTRSVEAAKPCPDGESGDTVAELSIVRRSDGVARRAADRLETWRCGAEPGPFWGGAPRGRFVVAWPRGVDSACAKAGVRYGGLTVATAKAEGKGAPRVERVGGPAEAIEDVGCDDERCVAVAVGRGEAGACVPADDEKAGALRVIVYPSAKGEGD